MALADAESRRLSPIEQPPAAGVEPFAVSAPSLALPKGDGAICGIGEKFAVNLARTGTGSMSVPLVTNPGRSPFGPRLSLTYASGAGNDPFGFVCSLSLLSITRKTDNSLPQFNIARLETESLTGRDCHDRIWGEFLAQLHARFAFSAVDAHCLLQ